MKNFVLLSAIIANAFSLGCFAQFNDRALINVRADNSRTIADKISQKNLVVIAYHVEERINMRFGGTITTYTVPSLNLVNTNDLGENNVRTITPKYGRAKASELNQELITASHAMTPFAISNSEIISIPPEKRKPYISINVLRTYERVLEKGYYSEEMLKRVGDWRYYEGDLEAAAKWYTELYCITTDLEVTFYFRYAQCLKFIGQIEKANEMMAIFESKK
jgi:hypothetical protein